MDTSTDAILELAEWRRRVSELYAEVRADPDPPYAWRRWRRARDKLFRDHPQSPLAPAARGSFEGLPFAEYDAAGRTWADVRDMPPQTVEVGTSDGRTTRFIRFGEAAFEVYGRAASLHVFWLDAYGGGIFLSFRDETSGSSTYGGGRYLLDTVKGADLGMQDGRLVLDFNFAYNPSCFYDPRWSCPLPPQENRLPFEIPVGERVG